MKYLLIITAILSGCILAPTDSAGGRYTEDPLHDPLDPMLIGPWEEVGTMVGVYVEGYSYTPRGDSTVGYLWTYEGGKAYNYTLKNDTLTVYTQLLKSRLVRYNPGGF
jgi:hypothetical protein